jgi:hypothetical protein
LDRWALQHLLFGRGRAASRTQFANLTTWRQLPTVCKKHRRLVRPPNAKTKHKPTPKIKKPTKNKFVLPKQKNTHT